MAKKKRRQLHGSAWHWKQTDCWYYTLPGSKRRVPLFDEAGQRIRGKHSREAARRALARIRLAGDDQPPEPVEPGQPWLVARVCSEYIQYCRRGADNGTLSGGHRDGVSWVLNDLCRYCGALPVAELKKEHIEDWVKGHKSWKSPATQRMALTIVITAFNYAADNFDVASPLKGLKKPQGRPRLHSLSAEEEKALYKAADPLFGDFLFAALHTGLRPFCELARLTAEEVVETERGMLWRVYSPKTRKTRKIPVRPEVADLTRRLMAATPRGSGRTLFCNSQGRPWKKEAGVWRFLQLKKKLGWHKDPLRQKYSCYSCRHTFAHRMLSGYWNEGVGCSIETLAELLGDTPKVAFDHYGKEWGQHYQEPLWRALGVPPPEQAAKAEEQGGSRRANKQRPSKA